MAWNTVAICYWVVVQQICRPLAPNEFQVGALTTRLVTIIRFESNQAQPHQQRAAITLRF